MKYASALHVAGLGAVTAIGRTAWASCAAQRAGIAGFVEHPSATDSRGEPIRVASAPWLSAQTDCFDRCASFVSDALSESLEPLANAASSVRLGVAIALPAARSDIDGELASRAVRWLRKRWRHDVVGLGTFAQGHPSGFAALVAAERAVRVREVDACVVVGVDSWLGESALQELESADLLHGAGARNNAWGRIPGEGAGALLVAEAATLARIGVQSLGAIVGIGLGLEEVSVDSDRVCIGEGLTQACEGALDHLPSGMRVDDVICDMNGERYRANEFAFTALRLRDRLRAAEAFVAPADAWGDVGAASAPLGMIAAVVAGLKGYASGRWALAWASSDSRERGAALLDLASR